MVHSSDLIIGIDSSTTACKAVVFDSMGRVMSEGSHPIGLIHPQADWHEQLAEDWWTALQGCLKTATQGIDVERIAALSIVRRWIR